MNISITKIQQQRNDKTSANVVIKQEVKFFGWPFSLVYTSFTNSLPFLFPPCPHFTDYLNCLLWQQLCSALPAARNHFSQVKRIQGWTKIMEDNRNGEGVAVPRNGTFVASATAK